MQKNVRKKILISTGGTGGHILPAIHFAQNSLTDTRVEKIIFVSKNLKTFQKKIKNIENLEISTFPISLKKFYLTFFFQLKGLLQSLKILKKEKPHIIIGFGSFHTIPMLMAAFFKKIPIVLFEPNIVLGRANSFFLKFSRILAYQFPVNNLGKLKKAKIIKPLPWNNFKKLLKKDAKILKNLDSNKFTILVFGGSQGANFINQNFLKAAKLFKNIDFQVIHLIGKCSKDLKTFEKIYLYENIKYYISHFEENMEKLYSAADIVIARAGASTISELIYFQKPAILIPFPNSTKSHQEENAKYFQNTIKGGVFLRQNEITPIMLQENLLNLYNNFKKFEQNIFKFIENEKFYKKDKFLDLILNIG